MMDKITLQSDMILFSFLVLILKFYSIYRVRRYNFFLNRTPFSFHKSKIDSCNEAKESRSMVPMERFSLEHGGDNDSEHHQRHCLLNDLELHERIGASIAIEPDAVGRHSQAILKECHTPRECYDS